MKVKVKSLQAGGQAPAPGEGGQGGPDEQLAQMAMQIVEQMGPEAAAALAQMIMQVLEQAAPAEAPAYAKKGGKLVMVR